MLVKLDSCSNQLEQSRQILISPIDSHTEDLWRHLHLDMLHTGVLQWILNEDADPILRLDIVGLNLLDFGACHVIGVPKVPIN